MALDKYPTRLKVETLTDRLDPVIFGDAEIDEEHTLTREQLQSYARNGFILFPELFSKKEVQELNDAFKTTAASPRLRNKEELIQEPDSDTVRSLFSAHMFHPIFGAISKDTRILNKVRQILNSDVYLHHSRINIKPAYSGKSFPWHSDFETWHAEDGIPNMRILTAWIMLTDNNEFNGPLYLIPGSHKTFVGCKGSTPDAHHKQSLRKQEYGVPSLNAIEQLSNASGLAGAYGKAGTLVIHEGNIMHGSPDNISPQDRTNLFFVYNSIHNAPAEKPFAAPSFRPPFLSNPDRTPVT